jgi:hypothetical protein
MRETSGAGATLTQTWTGAMQNVPFQPGQLLSVYSTAGVLKQYMFVKNTVAGTVGQAVSFDLGTNISVTNDVSTVGAHGNNGCGMLLGTVAASSWCWIQVWGPTDSLCAEHSDSTHTIATGDQLWVSATADGAVQKTAAGTAPTYRPIAVAQGAKAWTTSTVSAFLRGCAY